MISTNLILARPQALLASIYKRKTVIMHILMLEWLSWARLSVMYNIVKLLQDNDAGTHLSVFLYPVIEGGSMLCKRVNRLR